METQTTPFFVKFTGILASFLGGAFGLGKYHANLVKKKEIYHGDGRPIYLACDRAEKQQAKLQKDLSGEIANVNSRLDKIGEVLKTKYQDDLQTAKILGRIEQFMENYKP